MVWSRMLVVVREDVSQRNDSKVMIGVTCVSAGASRSTVVMWMYGYERLTTPEIEELLVPLIIH